MAHIPTRVKRRLGRLRKRRSRERQAPSVKRSGDPFRYDAALRLAGLGDVQETITSLTGVMPTHAHRQGDLVGHRSTPRAEDLWMLASPLGEAVSHDEHLQWLWSQIEPHADKFRELIREAAWADITLGCLSESAYPVLSVEPESLRIVRELKIGLSFNFTLV
jgi:hypothetical protein